MGIASTLIEQMNQYEKGQNNLIDMPTAYHIANPVKYYLATNNAGFHNVRGSRKQMSFAVIKQQPSNYGFVYATFTTRIQLAKRYLTSFGKDKYEIVEVKEISKKEAKRYREVITKMADNVVKLNLQAEREAYEKSKRFSQELRLDYNLLEDLPNWDTEGVQPNGSGNV